MLGSIAFYLFFLFFSGCAAWHVGILVPQPVIKPGPPAVEVWSPNHWTAREVQYSHFFERKLAFEVRLPGIQILILLPMIFEFSHLKKRGE